LKFGVLGPVRAWHADRELDLGAPQQRAVLAMLLLAEGRQVAVDALISGLWDEAPPSATGTVRTYVSRLRRDLEAAGGESAAGLIRSAGSGYVIPGRSATLDLNVFRRMVAQAQALKAGDPVEKAQAAALLRDALWLGRGEPLADIPGPYARSHRVWITELQLAANEDRLALEIELGGHVAAAAELQSLLAAEPMRERLCELLMLALYRSGRQLDALAVFEDKRRWLADEFGVDPGPALREMQQRILRTDVSLFGTPAPSHPRRGSNASLDGSQATPGTSAPVPLPVPAALAAPAQLPPNLPVFAGRGRELERLDELVSDEAKTSAGVTIAAIDGMPGMGKTALAVHWAYRVASRFPDGQLYANLRGFEPGGAAMTAGEALRGFLQALGAEPQHIPEDPDARASLYRSMLRERRVLVLLDNARDVAQVRPLLPGAPGCLVIVTSRSRFLSLVTAHGACGVTLEALPAQEALETLAARLGHARLAADPRAIHEIIDRCGGLPLAIAIVAARAAACDDALSEIAGELRDASTRLDALGANDAEADVRTVLSWSYRLLSEPARRLFRLLSLHCGPDISRNAISSLAGLQKAEAQPLLTELTNARLLTQHRPGRFTWHDLTGVYAAELSDAHDTPGDRHVALGRLLDYLLHTSHAAHLLLRPGFPAPKSAVAAPGVAAEELSNFRQAMAWFGAERQVLLAAVGHAAQHGFHGQAWRLALTLQPFCQRQGYWHDWVAAMGFALRAALDAEDLDGETGIRRSLAGARHMLGQDTEAIAELERATDLPERMDGPVGRAYLHSILGSARRWPSPPSEPVLRCGSSSGRSGR
jgi:DNA-binding SARP family transcriptional activator